ncbi:unnamed protein product [Phytophthora fragariaefolia]|uniref:Unnamed protein product n=1 Tax=Phytophthora fragariaefolia TaxID=1490495 RepID=A0A9W6XV36_9STRA|nr:unnamed protein product [Phytophthora fragariaefolia]
MASSHVAKGEANGEGVQLEDDIPGAVRGSESQTRLPWTKVWRSTDSNMLTVYRESLSSHSIVLCRSQRCRRIQRLAVDGEECPCRYKFKLCLSSSAVEVFHQGNPVIDTNEPASPVKRKLTQEMKYLIKSILSGGDKTTATRLYTLICTMEANNDIAGPAPRDSQVSDFVKNWRCTNPKDSMAPLISLCEGWFCDQLDFATLGDREMMILCDSQPV